MLECTFGTVKEKKTVKNNRVINEKKKVSENAQKNI